MYRARGNEEPINALSGNDGVDDILKLVGRVQAKREHLKKLGRGVREIDVNDRSSTSTRSIQSMRSSSVLKSGNNANKRRGDSSSRKEDKKTQIKRIFDSCTFDDSADGEKKEDIENAGFYFENFSIEEEFNDEDLGHGKRDDGENGSYYDGDDDLYFPSQNNFFSWDYVNKFMHENCGSRWILWVASSLVVFGCMISLLILLADIEQREAKLEKEIEDLLSPSPSPVVASPTMASDAIISTIYPTEAQTPSFSPKEEPSSPVSSTNPAAPVTFDSAGRTCFTTRDELKQAVNIYLQNSSPETALAEKYGYPIGEWCVSQITDFSRIFSVEDSNTPSLLEEFNESLNMWDTSSAIKMTSMFYGASSFNQDLSTWNVGKVEDFSGLFMGCEAFDQDLGSWDVSSGRLMSSMFAGAKTYQGIGLNRWDTSGAEAMEQMFMGASSFDGTIGGWDVSNVKSMGSMFNGATVFNRDLHEWRVSPEMDKISGIFEEAKAFNGRVDGWNIGETKIEKLNSIFLGASSFNQPLNDWDVSKVVNFDKAFASASSFNQSLASWDMSSARTLRSMFSDATSFNGDISNWNLGNAEEIEFMFEGAVNFNRPIGDWNVGSITNMAFAFSDASSFNQDLNQWDTRNVQQMEGLFRRARAFNGLISNWDVANVKQMDVMFFSAFRFNQDLSGWDMSSVERFGGMFAVATSFDQDLCEWTNTLSLPVLSGANDLDRSLDFLFGSDHLTVHPTSSLFHLSGCPAPQNAVYESESFRGPLCRPCGR